MRFARPIHAASAFIVAFAAIAASCAHHPKRAAAPPPPAHAGKTEVGVASWYGIPYHGRQTASGEIYDMYKLTAAHRNLPFQTWVEVENLANGKRVDVRINDRGPFARHRVIDLSQSAAKEIDMLGPGTARVRLTVVQRPANVLPSPDTPTAPSPPPPPVISETPVTLGSIAAKPALLTPRMDEPIVGPRPASGAAMQRFAVQAGAFADRERAEALRSAMANEFAEARTWIDATRNPPLWKVLVGREMTKEQATALALRVRKQNGAAIVVPEVASASPETEVPVP
jgi:rare lipoprotein A